MADYGDFEEVVEGETVAGVPGAPVRIRIPRDKELLGVVVQRLGGNRMEVLCSDGKTRNCRVPGRFKRSMWLREKDAVLIQLWEFDPMKGDIIFQYSKNAYQQLLRKGMLRFANV
ncbi:MAG TPA: translation initiation factor eIF-1A [Candidatus Nanoarchaeia archaeon]|nr:translation initiation factor eIF-1A [Candidatus Nanoarchaeia archaeon]